MLIKRAYELEYRYYTPLAMLYCTLIIVSVLLPYKIINFFGFSEPGGILIFPLTYLLAGAIAETYGRTMALKMVWSSLICLIIFNIIIAVIIRIPSAPNTLNEDVFFQAFGHSIRLSIGCLVGLIFSDITNIYKITGLKLFFGGRYFYQRCLWSTAVSEGIFNILTYIITYYGMVTNYLLLQLILYSWVLKIIYSIIMIIPLLYLMHFLKIAENIDTYDVTTPEKWINPELFLIKNLKWRQIK